MFRRLKNCHNVEDLRLLAKQRLPGTFLDYNTVAADEQFSLLPITPAS